LATNGDFLLATCEDFFMARDNSGEIPPNLCASP